MPVVCLGLHSQLAPVCASLRGRRVAYVQLAGGALPGLALGHRARAEGASSAGDRDRGLAVPRRGRPVRHGRGGDDARDRDWSDVVVCGIGPGIVGSGSRWGHGGLAVADAANVAVALGAQPVVSPRVSFGDERERHRGLSHHTRAALALCLGDVRVAWPRGLDRPEGVDVVEVDVDGWKLACAPLPLSHMGRGPADDPSFFAAAFAAGRLAVS